MRFCFKYKSPEFLRAVDTVIALEYPGVVRVTSYADISLPPIKIV